MSGDVTESVAWGALRAHRAAWDHATTLELIAREPDRLAAWTLPAGPLTLDLTRARATRETRDLLLALADQQGWPLWRDRLFAGDVVNVTEGRAAWHTALRAGATPEIRAEQARARQFVEGVRGGSLTGATGAPFRTILTIGIGGSHLGPACAVRALDPFRRPDLDLRFVANVDGADLGAALTGLDWATTLVIVASKTFTTEETLTNAGSARRWLVAAAGGDESVVARHFVALSTNAAEVTRFGIGPERTFGLWDWVGGRYSVWSAVGLPLALAIGWEGFAAFLAGAAALDEHVRTAPPARNVALMLGLLRVWYRNFWDMPAVAILPYTERLSLLPAHLQQLEMESNGKHVTREGRKVGYQTGQILFGSPGTNGQHAYYQLLHQGTTEIPAEFVLIREPAALGGDVGPLLAEGEHHRRLLAHGIAQLEALTIGRPDAAEPHRHFPGSRPAAAILLDRLDPHALGALLALYEHVVFVQGVLWQINSFDQFGVELGKTLAAGLLRRLRGEAGPARDSATEALLAWARKVDRT